MLCGSLFGREIIEIPTNGSGEVRRLVHTRSREIAGRIEKYYQPDAVINRQATKILYRSTYNNTVGDVYMFDVGNRNENDSVPPLAPSNIQGTSLINSIQLSWTAPAQASDGDLASFYKVYRNGSLIAETFNVRYTDQDLNEAQTYSYQIYSVDNVGNVSVESCSGDFQTLSDTEPPTLLSISLQSRTQIKLLFSEPVDQTTTDNVNNYQINNGLSVLSAVLQPDSVSVLLTTQTIELGVLYELGLENIRDVSANSNVIAAGTVTEFRFLSDFYEDFENSSTENWEFRTPQRWQIGQFDGNSALYITTSEYENPGDYLLGEYAILFGDLVLTNQFKVSYNAKILDDIFSNQHADHVFIFSFTDSLNYEYLQFHTYDVAINKIVNGERTYLEKFPYEFNLDQELHLSAIFENDSLYVLEDDLPVLKKYYPIHTAGRVGFGSFNDAGWFDNINLENIGEIDLSVPEPPTSLYSSGGTINSLILQWTAPIQPELFYRIYRDDVLIGESTDPVFTDTGLETIKTYHYKVYSVNYSGVQSEVAASGSFATSSDVEAPEITAMHINSRTEIHLEFSEPVEQNSAENTSNYVIDNQINVLQATLSDDSLTVVLQTEPIDLGEEYTLTVNNVTDVSANRNAIESNTIIPFGLYVDFFDDFETTVAENWTFYTDSRWSLTADNGSQTLFLNTTDF